MSQCYVMIKPGFVNEEIINDVMEFILKDKNIRLIDKSKIKYDERCAGLHYIEKQAKPYFKELTDYLTSGYSYGMVFEGKGAVRKCRERVEVLRENLKAKYNLDTDVMRNILHCSSKTKVGDCYLELDTQRELALFNYLKTHKEN